jgi:hypothetical protein
MNTDTFQLTYERLESRVNRYGTEITTRNINLLPQKHTIYKYLSFVVGVSAVLYIWSPSVVSTVDEHTSTRSVSVKRFIVVDVIIISIMILLYAYTTGKLDAYFKK